MLPILWNEVYCSIERFKVVILRVSTCISDYGRSNTASIGARRNWLPLVILERQTVFSNSLPLLRKIHIFCDYINVKPNRKSFLVNRNFSLPHTSYNKCFKFSSDKRQHILVAVVTSGHEFRLLPRNLTFYTYFIFSKHDQRRPNNKFEKGK